MMAYRADWLIENEIIYARFWGSVDADELRKALSELYDMNERSPRDAVHTITNTKGVTVPIRFQDSLRVSKEFRRHQRLGWEIVVGELDKITSLSISVSRSILRTKSINLKTMDEALNLLKKEDSSINWDKLNQAVLDDAS